MKNETICECGHRIRNHFCEWLSCGDCGCSNCDCRRFTAAKSLRDELVENCEYFDLVHTYYYCAITKLDSGKWSVRDADDNEMVEIHFDTPEAAFAWLKDHLKEQK